MGPIVIPGKAKKRAKMTAMERAKFKQERAEAKGEGANEAIATDEEVIDLLDRFFPLKKDPVVPAEETKSEEENKN